MKAFTEMTDVELVDMIFKQMFLKNAFSGFTPRHFTLKIIIDAFINGEILLDGLDKTADYHEIYTLVSKSIKKYVKTLPKLNR